MYHIIVNPASKSGRGRKLWNQYVHPFLKENGIEFKAHLSKAPGEVTRITEHICRKETARPLQIIVLGGDGTVNEVLQGLPEDEAPIVGYIPTGSSNDLARDLGIPTDPTEALQVVFETGKAALMDLGKITFEDGTTRKFAVSCGIGFDAAVCEEAMHSRFKDMLNRIGLGKLTYLGIAVKQIFAAKRCSGTLTLLDSNQAIPLEKLLFIAGMSHRYEGGGFMFCPGADAYDGTLNLCAVDKMTPFGVLVALPFALNGKHYIFKGITPYEATAFEVHTTRPLWVHTDGEVSRQTAYFKAECLPDAINFIQPQ